MWVEGILVKYLYRPSRDERFLSSSLFSTNILCLPAHLFSRLIVFVAQSFCENLPLISAKTRLLRAGLRELYIKLKSLPGFELWQAYPIKDNHNCLNQFFIFII
jgi:hypothetical protein